MNQQKSKNNNATLRDVTKEGVSPSEFMRARHPDLFSDSKTISTPQLPREVFEYHLDTLTRRKQEIEFEHFARKIAEKEICPNLIPQTGPTGGGDSKVDTETYPVSDEIALRWYEGIGQRASQERWGFAFSTKKDWKTKVRSDIQKIVDTNRGYKRIIFITSQFIEDRTRAKVQDELTEKHKVDVTIFDRSWLVKCIYEHDRLRLAAETLNITGYDETATKEAGPDDVRRQAELKELEENINDPDRYKGVEYQLVEDCLQAALLARGLELPRLEVDGRFKRAERFAEKVGYQEQKLRVFYNMAWTAYWWYEDYKEFNTLYTRVQELARDSIQASDLELLSNLWQLMHTAINAGALQPEESSFKERTETLKSQLQNVAKNTQRPNNALHAKSLSLLIDLSQTLLKRKNIDRILLDIKTLLEKSVGFSEFPVTPITQIIQELGEFITDNPKYDELLEVVIRITEKRASESEAGNVLLTRGQQKLSAGKKYDAIKLLGRAQQKLAMEESKKEWIMAAAACGVAYEGIGLLWAARSNLLMVTSLSFTEYMKQGKLPPHTLLLAQKLVWIELQLGRIPHVLAWMEFASLIASHLLLDEDRKEKYLEERRIQDGVLGILLLKADISTLKWLDFMPSVLESEDLIGSWMALLYALGYEDYLRSEKIIPDEESSGDVLNSFLQWIDQPASQDLPDQSELLLESTVTFHSFVLGCDVKVEADNNSTSIYLAEMILGALEAFLATSFDSEIMPYRSQLQIVVKPSDFLSGLPEYEEDEAGVAKIIVKHPKELVRKTQKDRDSFHSWLQEFIVHMTFQIAMVSDADSFANRLIKNEAGIGRAMIFAEVDIAMGNLFGDTPKLSITDWKPESINESFPYKREVPWFTGLLKEPTEKEQSPVKFGEGDAPEGLFGIDNLKHKDRQVVSLINIPLWDKAQWRATAYICFPDQIPMIVLGFKDIEAGKLIFKEWKNRFGDVDEKEELRISVVTGIDKKNPGHYTVVVSANHELLDRSKYNHFVMVSRMQTMEAPDLKNLNNFLKVYEKTGRYRLIPGSFTSENSLDEPIWDLWIGKEKLIVRPAWQIGQNDPDVVAIRETIDPIIPNDVKNPPVLQALQRFSKRKKRKRH